MRHETFMKQRFDEYGNYGENNPPTGAKADMVNHPPHYNATGIECIHAISAATGDGFQYYLQGNIMKYLWRYRYKDKPLEDLEKARWYLDKLIEEVMASDAS